MGKVDAIFERKPAVVDGVWRYGFPRSDLNVVLDGVTIKPALALGGWVALKPMGDEAMIMGDLVLTENEINPVMSKLLSGGVEVTALHNHFLRASPPTFYMHVGGRGDPVSFATHSGLRQRRSRRRRRTLRRRSISIRQSSTGRLASKERPLAAYISSAFRAPTWSLKAAWQCRPRWGRQT
jgi:hypothetical protein